MSFNFGAPAAQPGGGNAPAPSAFSFGTPAAGGSTPSFSFGNTVSQPPAQGQGQAPAAAPAPSLFGSAPSAAPAPSLFGAPPAAPPGSTGGLFGAVPATSAPALSGFGAASTAPATSSTAPAPAPAGSSTFSFAPAPAPALAPAPTTSGFGGFGTPAAPSGSAQAAPAPAPTTSGFGFGAPAAAQPGGGDAGGQLAPQPAPPALYKNMTVEEIITEWNRQLEEDANTFTNEAVKVAEWDKRLRDNQRGLTAMADQVQRLLLAQKELDHTMSTITGTQDSLEQTLNQLEKQVNELVEKNGPRHVTDADLEREQTFQLATSIDRDLAGMLETLKSVVGSLNSAFVRSEEGGSAGQIVKILNAHNSSLNWLEASAKKAEQELNTVTRQLKNVELR